ncbi:MAG TPA: phospholipase D-like domain-containing protein [Bacteroidales bacterium]|jgi:phosphatidylserine/phosphatidylglycerophosphate/cardiolipin synthase-like enzyme|nr:phospholipase D-like domain-containing protein [Bacteroidales bacterium]MDY0160663.1 phospholipase D-like domain-containing protein [Bacteroidales bacterium]HRW20844.1 phospholipase D-like domain-containing protein [Bacteroidales bacterium]HXK80856.1 phospholipase D-like domain-containing protein [Bacteroidales bacterium]
MKFITNTQIYHEVTEKICLAEKFVWIGTADIKDMHLLYNGKVLSFLAVLNDLINKKTEVRLLHAKEPGPQFRKSFDKYPGLWSKMERQLCPRVHFKHIIIDGKFAYTGSANLTGAGLGMKNENHRNFEAGIITENLILVEQIMQQFDLVWMGYYCKKCKRKGYCDDPII